MGSGDGDWGGRSNTRVEGAQTKNGRGENYSDKSREAAGMMALHEALRSLCLTSDWNYSVFWTIRPRPRFRGGSASKLGDDNGSLMLMWEDGFCKTTVAEGLEEDLVKKAFVKMSIQLYNYGEGLMGKVASDKCHKWIFKEPSKRETSISAYWQCSFDALPPEWIDQFNSGIQTIAVIQAGHGLLQLGSCKMIHEDLHFVLRMRHTFESLGYQSGFFLSQLFPSPTSSTSRPPPPPIFNLSQGPVPAGMGLPTKVEPHHFLVPQAIDANLQEMVHDHDSELKWPTGLSFFNALTGRPEGSKLLFGGVEVLGEKPGLCSQHDASSRDEVQTCHADYPSSNVDGSREEDANKGSSGMHDADSHGHHYYTAGDYRSSEAGINSDMMEAFLE